MISEAQALLNRVKIKQKYKDVFDSPAGQEVLHDIIRMCRLYSTSMDSNPNVTAFNEGRRAIGLEIMARLRMDNVPALLKLSEERQDNRSDHDRSSPDSTSIFA